jgi:hypothetical protein
MVFKIAFSLELKSHLFPKKFYYFYFVAWFLFLFCNLNLLIIIDL